MRLSSLQKFILTECYSRKGLPAGRQGGLKKKIFLAFYDKERSDLPISGGRTSVMKGQLDTVTKSVESLIEKGLMVGYGVRTPKKWYIEEVRLMPKGRKIARQLLGQQQKLPLKK